MKKGGSNSAFFQDLSHPDVERFGACHRLRGGAVERVGDLDADGRRRSRGAVTPHVEGQAVWNGLVPRV